MPGLDVAFADVVSQPMVLLKRKLKAKPMMKTQTQSRGAREHIYSRLVQTDLAVRAD